MKKITSILISICLLSACNKADQKKAGINGETAKEVEKIVSENGNTGCFIPYQAKVCELMDKETVAQILGIDAGKVEVLDAFKKLHKMGKNKDKPYKGSSFASCEYKWEDKTKKIKEYIEPLGRELEVDMYANVRIGNFAPRKDVAAFKAYYRTVSEEEMSKALEKADEIMEKDGKHTKDQVESAKNMGKEFAKGRTVTYLDNLGEVAASIRNKVHGEQAEVMVYYKGNEFRVEVKMAGKTHAQNMEYTLKIAREVLNKCK